MAKKKLDASIDTSHKDRPMRLHNKSDIPDNILLKQNALIEKCNELEKALPNFMGDFFLYLKNAVALSTRVAYLSDITFFCTYLITETNLTAAEEISGISEQEFIQITARDINRFLGNYCTRYIHETERADYIMENHNRSLARKRSSLSVLFKFLYREEKLEKNITEGFNPIKLPKSEPDAIKRLEIEEVTAMLDAVENGTGLTDKELQYWEKTKYRDKAILVLFTTYGLRVSELQQLNLSSFNYTRGEFKIYRKRGKEINMPINRSAESVVKTYIEQERPQYTLDSDDPLFVSLQGKRMTVRAIRELVKKYTSVAMKTPRNKGYSPHKLRATAASSLIQYGFSIYDVQNLLDHENVTTTQLYAAHKKNAKRDVVDHYELLNKDQKSNDDEPSE